VAPGKLFESCEAIAEAPNLVGLVPIFPQEHGGRGSVALQFLHLNFPAGSIQIEQLQNGQVLISLQLTHATDVAQPAFAICTRTDLPTFRAFAIME
jgi:hypothetical protein